jgi:hypothetical protein
MAAAEVALFVADRLFDIARYVNERNKGVEVLVTKMFFKPDVRVPALWEFDEDSFQDGMPVKVINNSKNKHYTISFFRFGTSYMEGKKLTNESYARIIPDQDHKNHDLAPGHAAGYSLPWETAMYSAARSYELLKHTKHVGDHTFTLSFHDDFENVDYPSKPLDPFLVRLEGSKIVHGW